MICKNDVQYIKHLSEQAGVPAEEPLKFDRDTKCASFVVSHWNNQETIQRYRWFYERFTDADEPVLSDTHTLFAFAEEAEIDFLSVAEQYQDYTVLQVAQIVLESMYPESKRQRQQRMSINDLKYDHEQNILLAEGSTEAYVLIQQVRNLAAGVNREQILPGMGGHLNPQFNAILALDDMGMRGKQIVFGAEYFDNDIQAFCKGVSKRDDTMIAYVNKKVAEEYDPTDFQSYGYLAVHGGASSTRDGFMMSFDDNEYTLNSLNYTMYASAGVKKKTVDYKSMDIVSGVDVATAVKIANAHGFSDLWRLDDTNREFGATTQIVMYNRDTGDFLVADESQPDDICYGGCKVIAARKGKVPMAIMRMDKGIHGNRENFENSDWCLYECNYQDGVFNQYKYLPECSVADIPWDKYPLSRMLSLPTPIVFNEHLTFSFCNRIPDNLSYLIPYLHDEGYTIPQWANSLVAADRLEELLDPAMCTGPFQRLCTNKYEAFAESAYFGIKNAYTIAEIFRISAALANLDHDECSRYIEAVLQWLRNDCENRRAKIDKNDRWGQERLKECEEKLDTLSKLNLHPDVLDRYVVSQFWKEMPEPNYEDLPKGAIMWMNTFAPDAYKTKDVWYLYGSMRNEYQTRVAENSDS